MAGAELEDEEPPELEDAEVTELEDEPLAADDEAAFEETEPPDRDEAEAPPDELEDPPLHELEEAPLGEAFELDATAPPAPDAVLEGEAPAGGAPAGPPQPATATTPSHVRLRSGCDIKRSMVVGGPPRSSARRVVRGSGLDARRPGQSPIHAVRRSWAAPHSAVAGEHSIRHEKFACPSDVKTPGAAMRHRPSRWRKCRFEVINRCACSG